MSFQTYLSNMTPFTAEKLVLADPEGQEAVLVLVSACFQAVAGDVLELAPEQAPIRKADVFRGDPATSSVLYEADIALQKPKADIVIDAHAYAPGGRPATTVPVHISVGDVSKDLLVSGDRFWLPGATGSRPSSPERFERMPIIFERAFGGTDHGAAEPRNLVGVGFAGTASRNPLIGTEVPNIEYPHARMASKSDCPEPAGLGVVGRGWMPRLSYAGTFDDAWLQNQWPLLPRDFDSLHNQCVSADQQSAGLAGGEWVRLINLVPEGEWCFQLPRLDIPLQLLFDNRHARGQLRLDTVLIEPEDKRVTMTSRMSIRVRRNRGLLREIVVGHPSPGWVRARIGRKRYLDTAKRGGAVIHRSPYELQ